jgi:16S rRNA (guanine966-N2)-methyltransferase
MRIIGGELKGRRFSVPTHFPVRPTTDFAREALFNILNNRVDYQSGSVLDLFCGTGSITLEAWSRGCRDITAVDKHAGCCKYLAQLIQRFDLKGIKILKEDALLAVNRSTRKFDLIFADPPYDYPQYAELVNLLMSKDLLNDEGLVVIEHSAATKPENWPGYENTRQYGSVNFSFLSKQPDV